MEDYAPTYEPYQFILELFRGVSEGYVEVMYKAPDGVKLYPGIHVAWADLPLTDIDPALPFIQRNNAAGYGVHLGMAVRGRKYEPEQRINKYGKPYLAYRRGKEADATYLTALWVDVDMPGDEGYRRIVEMAVPPAFIVSSGGGWHAYWLLYEPLIIHAGNRENIIRTLKGMAVACDGDTQVSDLARVMRLPGTVNTKPERNGARCEIVDSIPWRVHYEDLEVTYAPLIPPVQPQITRYVPSPDDKQLPRWIENYLATGAVQGERNATLNKAAWQLFNNGYTNAEVTSILTGRAMSDGLNEREINLTIASAERAKRGAPSLDRTLGHVMAADDHLLRFRK